MFDQSFEVVCLILIGGNWLNLLVKILMENLSLGRFYEAFKCMRDFKLKTLRTYENLLKQDVRLAPFEAKNVLKFEEKPLKSINKK
jgi:hypothetical protein